MKKTIKDLNKEICQNILKVDSEIILKHQMLNYLYSLHNITYNFLENNEQIRDRILKAIKKEQVKLENTIIENSEK